MTDTPTPPGFAPIFPGWNVWDVFQSQDPIQGLGGVLLNTGLSLDRQLQIWVEDATKAAPGAAVADPANPAALRGDQVQIIPRSSLQVAANRAPIPELGGGVQLGKAGSRVLRCTVRFFNRGPLALLPWPHDENYLLDTVFQPDPANPITNAPAPSSLPGALHEIQSGVSATLDTLVTVAALGVAGLVLITLLTRKTR